MQHNYILLFFIAQNECEWELNDTYTTELNQLYLAWNIDLLTGA